MCKWVSIKNYEDLYAINENGDVKNKKRNTLLKVGHNAKGYCQVSLWKNGKHTYKVHRLVAEHFIDNPNNYSQVNHIDNNKDNNSVENLEWCDCQYNIDFTISKKVAQYDKNGNLVKIWKSCSEAGRNFGKKCGTTLINKCCLGKIKQAYNNVWKYIK